jgi:hypothetical protein
VIEVAAFDHEIAEANALTTSLIGRCIALASAGVPTQAIGIASDNVG